MAARSHPQLLQATEPWESWDLQAVTKTDLVKVANYDLLWALEGMPSDYHSSWLALFSPNADTKGEKSSVMQCGAER